MPPEPEPEADCLLPDEEREPDPDEADPEPDEPADCLLDALSLLLSFLSFLWLWRPASACCSGVPPWVPLDFEADPDEPLPEP